MKDKMVNMDSQLLHRLCKGDEKAYEYVFHRYYNRIYAFALKTLIDKTFAEDITQSVFITLWEKRETINTETNLEPFLYTIARNHVYRQTERLLLKYKYEKHQQENSYETHDIEADVNSSFLKNILYELIEKLPQGRRDVFLLSRKENLSNKEIAKRLHISEKTVETQIRRSVAFLKEKMKHFLSVIW